MSTQSHIDEAARPALRPRAKAAARTGGGTLGRAPARLGGWLIGLLALRPRRAVALPLVAGALGLGVAAFGVFHPAPRDKTSVPAGDVALVNQQPILMSDFITETENAAGAPFAQLSDKERAASLRRMIDNELMVQRSLALDLPEQDTDVRSALIDGVTSQVNAGVNASAVTEDQLRAYFEANRAKYTTAGAMTVTDLVLHVGGFENVDQSVEQALADAAQAVYQLRSGSTVDYVKQHFGFVESGKINGEDLDFAAKIHLGAKLYTVAAQMTDGQISEPVADADGVHVMIMQHRRPPVFADFDAVRNNVYTAYLASLQAKAQAENLHFLRNNAEVLIAPGYHQ